MKLTKKQLDVIKRHHRLSTRQIQIIDLLFQGVESNAELSKQMDISKYTVMVHLRHLYSKFGARSKLAVVVKVTELLTELTKR